MSFEAFVTVAIYAGLALLAFTSLPGALFAAAWLGVGGWMISRTRARGFWADISFAATWPLYLALGR